jgi:hypothetical protein
MSSRITELSTEAGETGRRAAGVRDHAVGVNAAMEEIRHFMVRVVRSSIATNSRAA